MKGARIAGFLIVAAMLLSSSVFSQDQLKQYRIAGLKNIRVIAIVFRSNDQGKFFGARDTGDLVLVGLRAKLPELKVSAEPNDSDKWIEINYVVDPLGLLVEMKMYRWVRIKDTGEDIFAPVWYGTRFGVGRPERKNFKENVDDLLTEFAADYARANPIRP